MCLQDELRKLIVRHGGRVSRTMHARVDLLVASEKAVQRNTQLVRKALLKFGVPLVLPEFLSDSIAAGAWCNVHDYRPCSDASGRAGPPRPPKPTEAVGGPSSTCASSLPLAPAPSPAPAPTLLSVLESTHQASHYSPAKFNWRRTILKRLQLASGGALRRKVLRREVLNDFRGVVLGQAPGQAPMASPNANELPTPPTAAELAQKFRRRVRRAKRAGRIVVEGKYIRLAKA